MLKSRCCFFVLCVVAIGGGVGAVHAQGKQEPYPAMAAVDQYFMADESAEIALARSAAPESIAKDADVMVLAKNGYTTAVKGTNGFVCIVERGWASTTDSPDFWNPKLRAPNCFNAPAARSFLQVYLLKTKWVLAGKPKREIVPATEAAFAKKELPPLEPGAMVYMMSKQQYLGDRDKAWHPHLMFFVAAGAEKSWGANLEGSPIMGGNDPEEHVAILMMVTDHWSDGSAAPMQMH